MIELARANPAFRPVIDSALIGAPEAILLVEFSGDDRAALRATLHALVELMGDLGLPGSVVEMVDEAPQKALWEVRKAGLNIMMSLKGDGKPVSFIEDCAVPLEHLAEYTAALTEVFARHGTRGTWYAHASVGTLHVRPILDMRRDGARQDARDRRRGRRCWCASSRAHTAANTATACAAASGSAGSSGPKIDEAFRAIKHHLDPDNLFCPNRIVDPPRMDDASLFRFAPGYRTIAIKPAFDWSAWNVQNDPTTEAISAPGSGGDAERRLRQSGGDVQQQRPLPQVRCRHDVPELPRHARRAAPDARARQHAAAGAVGPARARCTHRRRGARRRSTCASAARAASAIAPPASTWRA